MKDVFSNLLPSSLLGTVARSQLNLVPNPYDPFIIKIAETKEELESAFKLFKYFSHEGLNLTLYHALPSTSVIIFVKNNEVCGTMSVIKDSSFGLPMDQFMDLSTFRRHQRITEITSFALAPDYQKESGRYLFSMMKYLFNYVENFMNSDSVIFRAPRSMKVFLDEILYFDSFEKQFHKEELDSNSIFRIGYLPKLHLTWHEKYLGKNKEANLSYFFDIFKENKFIFPNRIFFKDHDPVLNTEMLDHFFIRVPSILNEISSSEKYKLLHFYYMTPFFEPLKKYFNITEDIKLPRKNLRHDVLNRGLLQHHKWQYHNSSHILDVSKEGLSIQVNDSLEKMILKNESQLRLKMKIGFNRFVELKIEPIHDEKEKSLVGCKIIDANKDWENYIDFLNSDLMKDVFIKKVS